MLKTLIAAALVAAFFMSSARAVDVASYYGRGFNGHRTASGSIYNQNAATCAHRTLPFGTRLRVTRGNRTTHCTVTDRGPFVHGRTIDLSHTGARDLDLFGPGHAVVIISKE